MKAVILIAVSHLCVYELAHEHEVQRHNHGVGSRRNS